MLAEPPRRTVDEELDGRVLRLLGQPQVERLLLLVEVDGHLVRGRARARARVRVRVRVRARVRVRVRVRGVDGDRRRVEGLGDAHLQHVRVRVGARG